MIFFDAAMRFSGLGLLLLTMVLIIRDLKKSSGFWYLLLANIGITSHFLGFTPDAFALPYYPTMVLRFVDVFQLYFMWLFALSLFHKDFVLKPFHLIVGVIYAFPMIMERCVQFGFVSRLPSWWPLLVNGLNILMIAHMIVFVLQERGDDLIEKRRRSRLYLVLMMAISATIIVVFAHILLQNGWTYYQPTVNIVGMWPAIVWSVFWLVHIDKGLLAFDLKRADEDSSLSHVDQQLLQQLNQQMTQKHCYLEPHLSIDSLAKRLGVSAYRLRAFINQTLGFQNFSTYVNTYRIEAIKKALIDPQNQHIPILTIAMEHGFNSLSPFNRSFKKMENMTPKMYREQYSAN